MERRNPMQARIADEAADWFTRLRAREVKTLPAPAPVRELELA